MNNINGESRWKWLIPEDRDGEPLAGGPEHSHSLNGKDWGQAQPERLPSRLSFSTKCFSLVLQILFNLIRHHSKNDARLFMHLNIESIVGFRDWRPPVKGVWQNIHFISYIMYQDIFSGDVAKFLESILNIFF